MPWCAQVQILDELGEDLGVTPTLGRLLRTLDWKKLRAAYWTPMTANHYRLVGPDAREAAASQIWEEYKGASRAPWMSRKLPSELVFRLVECVCQQTAHVVVQAPTTMRPIVPGRQYCTTCCGSTFSD